MPKMGKEAPPTGGGGGGDFIRHVRLLTDKEACVVRFLTEYGDFYWERFHRVMDGGKFKGMKICVKSALGQACELCEGGDRPGTQFLGWAYEFYHDYTTKPSFVKAEDIEQVQVGKRTVFREEINEPRLMRYSIMHFDSLKYQFDEEDTLVDRDFKWTRIGEAGSKRPTYILKPGQESKTTKELRELAATLPDLEDIAFGRVESFDGAAPAEAQAEVPKTRKVSPAKAKPKADDEDDEPEDPFADPSESDDDDDDTDI